MSKQTVEPRICINHPFSSNDKVKKKYGGLGGGGVVMAELTMERGSAGGLGISLAGHKDRTKMAVLIAGLNPSGRAYSTGQLQVGDEILEVNGIILQGRCHLNASAIIKALPGPLFKIIALRKAGAVDELSVKPITQFPLSLKEESLEQKYAGFKGVKTVNIKKQSGQGLGIMILEGKHPEVGQGIFISDILEGSAAEQAGLCAGDMILSVNKDSLLGSNFESAAGLLKKTEGIVTLVVCNPNEGKESKQEERSSAATPSDRDSSANQTTPASKLAAPTSLSPSPSNKLKSEDEVQAATAEIVAGKECLIEIAKDKLALGLSLIGGSDTPLGSIIILEAYPEGAAAKDGRLKPGDIILEMNGEDFRDIAYCQSLAAIRQLTNKVLLLVYRHEQGSDEVANMSTMEVELTKKPGKGLGLSITSRRTAPGIFVSDVMPGSVASSDGRLTKGDRLLSVNGIDVTNMPQEEAAAIVKTITGKVSLKIGRYKAR